MKTMRTEGLWLCIRVSFQLSQGKVHSLWCYLSHLNKFESYSWICDHGRVETFLLDYVFKQFEEEKHKFGEFKEN